MKMRSNELLELLLLAPLCSFAAFEGLVVCAVILGFFGTDVPHCFAILINPFALLLGLILGIAWLPARRWRRLLSVTGTVGQILCLAAFSWFMWAIRQDV